MATATDICDASPVVTFVDVTNAGDCPQEYTITRTWTATDACGNSSTCIQVLSIEDNAPPTITCPTNTTVQCVNQIPPVNRP
ncbi:MAG: hypothetical protein IPN33_26085 [Saprospiraceae bacterium]|nr:hypothetical protein [Saprospiraceae bacterium]